MAAWVIAAIQSVHDEAGFAAYQEEAGPLAAKYGGKRLASGTKIEIADGTWSPVRVVVLEFEDLEKAKLTVLTAWPESQVIHRSPQRVCWGGDDG